MKRSPLYTVHTSLNARFIEIAGWEVPHHYGDPLSEHRAVREAVGMIDLTHRARVRLTGRDRGEFLQGMATNNIKGLTEGTGLYTAFTNAKGHMIADATVSCYQDSLFLDLEPGTGNAVRTHLSKFAITSDVTIEDVTEKVGLLSIQGPASTRLLTRLFGIIPSLPECSFVERPFERWQVPVVRSHPVGEEGYDLLIPCEGLSSLWDTLCTQGRDLEILPFGMASFETLRIEAGRPRYGIDMDEGIIAPEAGIEERGISYEKGCYLGQETIARLKFRGHLNKKLVGIIVESESPPEKGDTLRGGERQIGVITSGTFSPTLKKVIALGYVHRDFITPGTSIVVETGGKRQIAVVAALPFYARSLPLVCEGGEEAP